MRQPKPARWNPVYRERTRGTKHNGEGQRGGVGNLTQIKSEIQDAEGGGMGS